MTPKTLTVEVANSEIIVSQPGTTLRVTYRRELGSRMLVADEILYRKDKLDTQFLAQAWRATFDKAKSLGWL